MQDPSGHRAKSFKTSLHNLDALKLRGHGHKTQRMSLVEEFAKEFLQEENLSSENDQVPCKDKDVNVKDHPQADKRTSNPLRLLKDDMLKVFRDKPEHGKPADVKKEKMVKHLSLLEEDFSRFKDDLSNVFRFGLSMEKDKKKDSRIKAEIAEGTNKLDRCSTEHVQESKVETLKTDRMNNNIKDRKNELDLKELKEKSETSFCKTQLSEEMMSSRNPGRPTEFFNNLFRREKNAVKASEEVKLSQQFENRPESKEEQLDCRFRETLSQQNSRDRVNQSEDGLLGLHLSVTESEKSLCETQKTAETMCSLNPDRTTGYYKGQKNTGSQSPQTVEDPAQEIQELEISLKDDYFSNHFPQEKDTKVKDHLQTDPREMRTILTEDWFEVAQNKDSNVEHNDHSSSHIKNKPNISILSLLKEDVSFSFSLSKDKAAKAADPKLSQTTDTSFSRLSLLKDDLSNVFRFSLSREKDKDEASKMKALKTQRTDDSLKNLLKRDQNVFATAVANKGEVKAMLSEKKEELNCSFRQNLSEHIKEKLNTEEINTNKDELQQAEDSELGVKWLSEISEACFYETQQSEKMTGTSDTGKSIGFFKNLFRREQNPSEVEDNQQAKNPFSEQWDVDFMKNKDNNRGERVNQPEDSELGLNVSEKKSETSSSETHQSGENMSRVTYKGFGDRQGTESESAVVVEQHSQEKTHRESEIPLTGHSEDLEDHKDKDHKINDALQTTQRGKIRPLALLKEDFNHLRDDLLNVLKTNLSVGKGNEEGTSQLQVLNAPKKEKRDVKLDTSETANLLEPNKETIKTIKGTPDQPDGSKLDVKPQARSSETKTQEEMMVSTKTVRFSAAEEDINAKRDQVSGSHLWESFGIKLLSLTQGDNDTVRVQPGDVWSLKNFATYLTLDPNTANSELHLTDGNRKATRVWSDHPPLDHPDRFMHCPQVLCREGLLDSVYWEVEWSGGADIGIAYNNISRDGDMQSCLLGHNERSWSLECSEGSYTPCYNNVRFRSSSPELFTHRVGVYLNWSAGTLSFYCVSQDTMIHLHTFTSTFTEPLYAGFWIWAYEGSASLCQVKLDWERLQ